MRTIGARMEGWHVHFFYVLDSVLGGRPTIHQSVVLDSADTDNEDDNDGDSLELESNVN